MTAREMIDGLSDTLLCDERILSVSERELLTNLLQRAQANSCGEEAATKIAHVVGEVVAERAYSILGDSIAKRLLRAGAFCSSDFREHASMILPGSQTPSLTPLTTSPSSISKSVGGPQPPSPSPPAQGPPAPHGVQPCRMGGPQPPSPSPPAQGPRGPHGVKVARPTEPLVQTLATGQLSAVAVMEAPQLMPAECVLLDEFLAPAELNALLQDTLQRELEFQVSEVVSPGVAGGSVDYEHRRSRVLLNVGKHQQVVLDRLQACLPRVLARLGRDPFPISRVECQVTASNHGDFFRWHSDNGQEEIASREITFVYFFHREPKQFRGGELRIYDSRWENHMYVPTANYRAIVPEQNQVVLFTSSLAHEITPVECPGGAFADSRFTLNGWFHR